MFADTYPTGTLDVSPRARCIRFGLMAGWLILGLAVANLIVTLAWTGNLVDVLVPNVRPQEASASKGVTKPQTTDRQSCLGIPSILV